VGVRGPRRRARLLVVKVPVALFARYREVAGRDRLEVEVPEGATVEQVWAAVSAAHPVLASHRPHTLFAIGNEYVPAERPVQAGEEVACFPPVSGGGDVPRHG
jgi:molybdopterin converting factor subunit 1